MKIIEFIKSKKNISEKNRILYYRIKKNLYKYRTKLLKNSKNIKSLRKLSGDITYLDQILINRALDSKNEIVNEATRIIEGNYRSISGRIIKVAEIDWNFDYILGYKWESKHYSKYILKNKNIQTDVKHVWEMSRFYHLPILAQAFAITKDEVFCDKIIDDLLSWKEQNPLNFTVNWTVSMEVAIRVVNIIQAISLIRDSNRMEHNTVVEINDLIYKHGTYIFNNLEKGLNTNNHYLANLVGMIWIGVYFKNFEDEKLEFMSKKMLQFSIQQLVFELKYQIYDDGFSYEDSVSYHGLNTEMMLLTIIVLEKNGIRYPELIKDITNKMVSSLNILLDSKGDIPVFGDLDNGRLMICDLNTLVNKLNFKYLLEIASDFNVTNNNDNLVSPTILEDSGLYKIFNPNLNVIVRCGQIGLNGLGGHAHNDQLSFVLSIRNENIIIDPGTGYYSGDYTLRNMLRSTNSHNTLYIEGYEQNDISIDIFKMKQRTKSEMIYIDNKTFEGKHFGYFDDLNLVFKRKIEIEDSSMTIYDSLNKYPEEKCNINYILDSDVSVELLSISKVLLFKKNLEIELCIEGGYIELVDQLISKSYSEVISSRKIKVTLNDKSIKSTFYIRKEGRDDD